MSDLNTPEPPPKNTEEGEAVWPWLLEKTEFTLKLGETIGADMTIGKLILIDEAKRNYDGVKKYGVELKSHNGRDWMIDDYQEAMDLKAYAGQGMLETTNREELEKITRLLEIASEAEMILRTMIYKRDGK